MSAGSKPIQYLAAGHLILVLFAMCVALAGSATGAETKTLAKNETTSLSDAQTDSLPIKIPLVDGQDIRFRRLSKSASLSQTRVASVVQDKVGFIRFGTQYGLNRCDGYTSKVFKHEPGHSDSLSCVYIRSLFVDHSGTLWVGCDRFLDKYEPVTETFAHYPIHTQVPGSLPTPIERINEDDAGMLWLATEKGLYKFDPVTGESTRYTHNPADPTSIAGNDVKFTGQDRTGQFWVADSCGLDAFDRKTGKITLHVPFRPEIGQFQQHKFGVFWIPSLLYLKCLYICGPFG